MEPAHVRIRIEGATGRITLARPQALNALSYAMCLAIDRALVAWAADPAVRMVLIDAEGPRAFCAGGDLGEMHAAAGRGDLAFARRFWRDEYRMNDRIDRFPVPVVSLMQGFVMGGGVGVGCHADHRVVGESSRIAMPECAVGLIPDVGGSCLLARAPGHLGDYLGVTGARMGPADAILAGFADAFVPEADWPALTARLLDQASPDPIAAFARPAPAGKLSALRPQIDAAFATADLGGLRARLAAMPGDFAAGTLATIDRVSPLSAAATLVHLDRLGDRPDLRSALAAEYRFTFRALDRSDFPEGIRAAIIDKDHAPHWRHAPGAVPADELRAMLAPLGADELTFKE
jgi:enoyl-CoA hydratase/carnithine racemase